LAYGAEIEIRDPDTHTELFHVRPDFRDTVPYLKCFHINESRLACSAGNGWTQINVFDLEAEGKLNFGWTSTEPHPIEAIAFTNSKLVTGSRKCIVWDLTTRTPIVTFSEQQRGVVNCLQFDDEILACSHKGRKVRIWDIKSGKRIFTIQGHQHLVHCLQYDDHFLATGSKDKTLRIWDKYKGYQCSAVLRGHTESVRTLSLHGWKVISGSKDGDVRIWDITSPGTSVRASATKLATSRSTKVISTSATPTWSAPVRAASLPSLPALETVVVEGDGDGEGEGEIVVAGVGDGGIRSRSVGRLAGAEPVFSVATSSSRLYVGTRSLKVYDFAQLVPVPFKPGSKMQVLDKFLNIFMSSEKVAL